MAPTRIIRNEGSLSEASGRGNEGKFRSKHPLPEQHNLSSPKHRRRSSSAEHKIDRITSQKPSELFRYTAIPAIPETKFGVQKLHFAPYLIGEKVPAHYEEIQLFGVTFAYTHA